MDRHRLEAFLSRQVGTSVAVRDLTPVRSVGNARTPWSFTATWPASEVRCVLLVQAAAGQLETELGPEFATIAALHGTDVPVARALWVDPDGSELGAPGFVTEWVPGSAETRSLRDTDNADVRDVALSLAAAAARLHALDVARFAHLAPTTVDCTARRQLDVWDASFRRQRLEPHPALCYVARWLRDRLPVARRISLVHGDLRFGNLLADGARLTALLDWEMTHLGDPVEDLGWAYRAIWTPVRSLPFDDFLAAYVAAGGDPVAPEHLRWYRVFGEFKHAVISLTATRSFADGSTSALRHANRAATVPAFVRDALALIEQPC